MIYEATIKRPVDDTYVVHRTIQLDSPNDFIAERLVDEYMRIESIAGDFRVIDIQSLQRED